MKQAYIIPEIDFEDMEAEETMGLGIGDSNAAVTSSEDGKNYIEAGSKEASSSLWSEE